MIFIEKIKLHGFKSFAEKTELVFKSGISCIVGPCGCGRSNIVDSLKWVFGETKISKIRVATTADIIFAGSNKIKPLDMAEVEVILNNNKFLLPIKDSKISVTRKFFRSGKNEYAINKKQVKLEDIHNLFKNTVVGKQIYSFMGLDIMAAIMDSEPAALKVIFEETAEIVGYNEKLFIETFNTINENYNNIFKKLFGGGRASIRLLDKKNVFTSKIMINIELPGERPKIANLLPTPKRVLNAIALMFAIFMVKNSPFCVLDEIDSPLDEQSIEKFLALIKEFSKNTQFLIVSHNKKIISECDYLYGITMEQSASKVISLNLQKFKSGN